MASKQSSNGLTEESDEKSNIIICGSIIIIIVIIIIILICCMCKNKNQPEDYTIENIIPIYITTLNNDISKKRYKAQRKVLKYFDFKHMKKNKALHWKTDNDHIKSKYPMINETAPNIS